MTTLLLDEQYRMASGQLAHGQPADAEATLAEALARAPRAAQSVYLRGIAVLMQGRHREAAQLLDHAYQLKPWIRDLPPAVADLRPYARAALAELPDWAWARYELGRHAFSAAGLTVPGVVQRQLDRPDVFFVQVGANRGRSRRDPVY